ncbi:MAG TPA: hypothetical protein VGH13_11575 [Xanthobacteraceae bacterium]|jgi:hypothetical protein
MRKPDVVEVVAIAVPLLVEAVAVFMFIAMVAVWIALGSGQL